MTNNDQELKRQHELVVATDFVSFLRESGHELGDPRAGDIRAREPDAVCDAQSGPIGIEVGGAYNCGVAGDLWGYARGKDLPPTRSFVNPDLELATELNNVLAKHCGKVYCTPTTFLVLDAGHAPLTSSEDAAALLARIQIPEACPFRAVYLRLKQNYSGAFEFIKVFGP